MLTSLYELSADCDTAIAEMIERYGGAGEGRLLREVERLLADVSVQPDLIVRIAAVHRRLASIDAHPEVRGPVGLCLFLDLATRASLHEMPPRRLFQEAKEPLADDAVKSSLRVLYKLDEDVDLKDCSLDAAELHQIGTTSVILECEKTTPKAGVALKCVLPRHFSVRAITQGAKQYGELHKAILSIAPEVYGSNERAVMMEFVHGRTLAERLEDDQVPHERDDPTGEAKAHKRALRKPHVDFIRALGKELCDVLEKLHAKKQCHLDLSPRNVILVHEDPLDVRLIDFGQNFAIAEGVASSLALARASVYVEPQMITRQRVGDWRSDCYSLGIILLEAAARQPLHRETIARELWRLWTGEHSWDGAPGLARIIEDLIDAEPRQRLAFMSDRTTVDGIAAR
jgi:serine/threonine protein kinase